MNNTGFVAPEIPMHAYYQGKRYSVAGIKTTVNNSSPVYSEMISYKLKDENGSTMVVDKEELSLNSMGGGRKRKSKKTRKSRKTHKSTRRCR